MKSLLSKSIGVIFSLVLLSACASMPANQVPLHLNSEYYNYLQADFETYVATSRQWLRYHREFITEDHAKEIDMNAPFILKPETPSDRAALLVHGLGDSPYSFSDIAESLQQEGYAVYVLLLPGHGSKPADLILSHYEDWQQIVDHYANQLKSRFDELWLGGFSTGGNLITIHTIEQGGVDGLLLFSPGFETYSPFVESLAPIVATFTDWGWRAKEDNLAKYASSPINASIAYSESAKRVRTLFEDEQVSIPTLMVMSEADSVIDPYAIKDYFGENFTHRDNRFIWYGESLTQDDKIRVSTMKLPEHQISTGSHMSPLFAPENPYYGAQGEKRMCGNGFSLKAKRRCLEGEDVWFSAWGHTERDKIFARLTWNPYYADMMEEIGRFLVN